MARDIDPREPVPVKVVALVIALLVGLAFLPRLFAPRNALTGKPAPDFTLAVLANGETLGNATQVVLSEQHGKVVLLDFSASWCPPCRAQAPILEQVASRYRDQGLVVMGVDTNDEAASGRAWAKAGTFSYPVVYDTGSQTAAAFGVEGLPTLVLISKDGTVVAVRTGVVGIRELEALVRRQL
jgi:cytochrome c biogenesis protein CcmG/thiol:disulfide interchange protein DsbE